VLNIKEDQRVDTTPVPFTEWITKNLCKKRDAHLLHGSGAGDSLGFCGRVAVKSFKAFGRDTYVCGKASCYAGAISFLPVTYVACIVGAVATAPFGGAGAIVGPVIGAGVTTAIAIGGTCGGLVIGAGHAVATPFIEMGKVTRAAIDNSYHPKTGCLPKWTCCSSEGSWAEGCKRCNLDI